MKQLIVYFFKFLGYEKLRKKPFKYPTTKSDYLKG